MPSLDDSDGRLLDRIFETSPTAIVVLTPEGTITRCNARAQELLALEGCEIEGRNYSDPAWRFTDQSGEPLSDEDHPFVRVQDGQGPIFDQEYRMERHHAEPLDLSISGAPIVDDGDVSRLVFSFEDITEQREREEELEMMTRQLEVLNRVVRHDIRNEMAIILGYIETAAGEVSEPDAVEYLDRAHKAGEHVVSITNAARDLMQVVTQSNQPELKAIPLKPILEEELELIREGHSSVTVVVEDSIPAVDVRATELLDSVFRNLLTNAIDHHDGEEPTVTVSASQSEDRVEIAIADDGPGIPDSQKWQIFGKGTQGFESDGTGIGLYLVEGLVAQFGGDVRVEDNEPRGTRFVVELQLAN